MLTTLISPTQSNFVKNRRASDNAIIMQELIPQFKKTKGNNGKMLVKIDLEKAFDKLEWSFIYKTLLYFKIPPKMSKLIMSCISTTSSSVLVNGRKTKFFHPCRGRQGNSMSPYIFYIVHENVIKLRKPSSGH